MKCLPDQRNTSAWWPQSLLAIGTLLIYTYLAYLSHIDGRPTLPEFGTLLLAAFFLYATAWLSSRTRAVPAWLVIAGALAFRLAGVAGAPLFEDDYFRYLWDGYRFAQDGTPYGIAPEAYFRDAGIPQAFQRILGQINHPDIPTLYGPSFEYLFLANYWVAPGQVRALQCSLCGIDIALVWLLLRIAGPRQALLYAWNPLVIKEIAFTAHPDGLIAGGLIAAWYFGQHKWPLAAGIALAIAAASKVSAWLLVPFVLINFGASGLLSFALAILGLYLPFVVTGATEWAGLRAFAEGFEFNSALFALVRAFGYSASIVRQIFGGLLVSVSLVYAWMYWHQPRPRVLPRGDLLFASSLLIAPVINPWYLLWLLPYSAVYPSFTAMIGSVAVLLAYVVGLNLDEPVLSPYQHPAWIRPLEFGLIASAWLVEVGLARKHKG